MKHIFVSILFMLACSTAFSNSLQKSEPDKQLPLTEAYRLGRYYVTQQTDSALYYLGLITSRYNEDNIDELTDDEQKLVGYSYYNQAGVQAYYKYDYEASMRSLITGVKICNDDTLRFQLQQTIVLVLIGLVNAMPTPDNCELLNYYNEQCFRKALQLKTRIWDI